MTPTPTELTPPDPWTHLRRHTGARIALGRAGGSLPTHETLSFAHAHALARDAVQAPFNAAALAAELRSLMPEVLEFTSAAPDRATYIARPDLGRLLSPESAVELAARRARPGDHDLAIIVSDGLSALAAQRQAPPLLAALLPLLRDHGFKLAPLCIVRHGRVGLLDEVGPLLQAELALILLGERPGLGTPDSLSAYFVYGPQRGRTDADRNCVSNIRPKGLSPAIAARRITELLVSARQLRLSGTALKETPNLESATVGCRLAPPADHVGLQS